MRIGVLADIHGNLPALRAVLAELDRDPVDAIVVPGDVVGGPLVAEVLDALTARSEPVHFIRGNCEREAVAAYDGAAMSEDDPAARAAAGSAETLTKAWRDRLASWPIALSLDGVLFCHGSPRRDDEILTRATPTDVLADALDGAAESVVVGGHTHQQLIRDVRPGLTYANAGSVGMPYEGRPAAFWMIVTEGTPELHETAYDVPAAIEELTASGYPALEEQLRESLIDPVDPDWVSAFFEHGAGRGEDPGDPQPCNRDVNALRQVSGDN
ncbi:MAG TPA: metallophosphoesterase family protein [Solirubrobacteraceae bacterium]